ncbi:MAG: non-homologous end-joining DNA ligase [Candidatus Babeliales bacterium]
MERKVGKHIITTTNEDVIWFPKSKITKGDVLNYYEKIAPIMVPHMYGHPVTMLRYVDGIQGEGFYHKDAPTYFPKWIKRCNVAKKEDGTTSYVLCNEPATLVYLAQQACLVPHLWLSKCDKLNSPDLLIFDLDPAKQPFSFICDVALRLKEILEANNLVPFIKLTGSRGLHVTVPIKRLYTFDFVRDFAKEVGQILVEDDPKNLTMEIRKEKRKGRLFIDINRNGFTATAVAPYAIRAYEKAPVAAPLLWDEVKKKGLTAQKYNISNIFKRLSRIGDPWHDIQKHATKLP